MRTYDAAFALHRLNLAKNTERDYGKAISNLISVFIKYKSIR